MDTQEPATNSRTDAFFDAAENMTARVQQVAHNLDDTFHLKDRARELKLYTLEHPILVMCAAVTIAMCAVPVICFCAFVVGSTIVTFTVFMFVEGFMLVVATTVLCLVLLFVGLIALCCSSILAASFYLCLMLQKAIVSLRAGIKTD